MDTPTLKLDNRTLTGKKVRRLRKQGVTPVHVYGAKIEPVNLQVDDRTLNRLLPQVGSNIPISVEYEGQEEENICFVREVQRHPVTDAVIHVDFLRVDVTRTVAAEVPLTLVGTSPAVSQMAGTLLQNIQSISIEALPMDMPSELTVDLSELIDFDKVLAVRDVETPDNVTVLNNPEDVIVRVAPPRLEVELEDDLEEGEEGEEGAESEDADGDGEE